MSLKRARPLDEVVEIAGEDYDYDDLGGREERIERRKKRRSRRKKRRSKRLKSDSDRLRREAKVTSSRSSRRKKRRSSRKSSKRTRPQTAPTRASEPQSVSYPDAVESYDDYEDEYLDEYEDYDDYPAEEYDPEDFEDPYEDYIEDEYDDEFEGEFAGKKKGLRARRKARKATRRKNWEKAALVGKLRIHAKKGHRAAIRELEPGLYLVAEIAPGDMENLQKLKQAELAGGDPELGALSLISRLASLRARRALNKQAQPTPTVMMPAPAPTTPALPSTEPTHPWYDKSKVPPGVGGAVVTQPGDTMWGIASKYLGSGMRWNQIYLVNASQLQGKKPTEALNPGLVLWLPTAPTGNWLSA